MNLERFCDERRDRWAELRGLVDAAGRRTEQLRPDAIRRLGALYRATAADLAHARRRFPGEGVVAALDELVGWARPLVYAYERPSMSPREFVTTGYWRRVRERPRLLLASALLLMAPWVLASVWAVQDPGAAAGLAPAALRQVAQRDTADFGLSTDKKAATASYIFTNNIRVAFVIFALGILGVIGAAFMLVYQGMVLGASFGLTIDGGNGRYLFEFAFAHGVLEISCIIVVGAAGMRMGMALLAPGRRRRGDALVQEARAATEIALGTALCLVVAGLVEGTISTSGIGMGPAIALGLTLGSCYWGLVFWRGRVPKAGAARERDRGALDDLARPLTGAPAPSP